jgi:hypothetical protein
MIFFFFFFINFINFLNKLNVEKHYYSSNYSLNFISKKFFMSIKRIKYCKLKEITF